MRGTGRAGSFSFMLCFPRSLDIFHKINLQISHTWDKNGFVMAGGQPFSAAVCGFFLYDGDDPCLL